MVDVGLLLVLGVDAAGVGNHLLRRHYAAAGRASSSRVSTWMEMGVNSSHKAHQVTAYTAVVPHLVTGPHSPTALLQPRDPSTCVSLKHLEGPWPALLYFRENSCAAVSSLEGVGQEEKGGDHGPHTHGQGPSPDGAVGVDLSHHFLPPGEGAIVANLPEGVVLDGAALFEFRACSTLVKFVTLWGVAWKGSVRLPPRYSANTSTPDPVSSCLI